MMRVMTERLGTDPEMATAYLAAHEDYLRRRGELGEVAEIEGISAGGMPSRVKCLHVLVGHSLAVGPGVNPFGDEALEALGDWWKAGSCVPGSDPGNGPRNGPGSDPGSGSGSDPGNGPGSGSGCDDGGQR